MVHKSLISAQRCVFGAALCITAAACSSQEIVLSEFQDAARKHAETSDLTPIALREFTPFSWDRVFLFSHYTPYDAVEKELGFPWPGVTRTGITERDDGTLVVFVRDDQVVNYAIIPNSKGDLTRVRAEGGLNPNEAVFVGRVVDQRKPWIMLELVDSNGR